MNLIRILRLIMELIDRLLPTTNDKKLARRKELKEKIEAALKR